MLAPGSPAERAGPGSPLPVTDGDNARHMAGFCLIGHGVCGIRRRIGNQQIDIVGIDEVSDNVGGAFGIVLAVARANL